MLLMRLSNAQEKDSKEMLESVYVGEGSKISQSLNEEYLTDNTETALQPKLEQVTLASYQHCMCSLVYI